MAGQRRVELVSIALGPGVLSNTTARDAKSRVNYMMWDRWIDCQWVRWLKALPQKIGGWAWIALTDGFTAASNVLYQGKARGLFDWASIDGQFWIAIGTHLKLYLVNNTTLWDITPFRKTTNVKNNIAGSEGSQVLVFTDVGHQANDGDFVDLSGTLFAGTVFSGGATTIDGDYEITVIDPDTWSIGAPFAVASGQTFSAGGGSYSINYEISTGLPANGFLYGYGTGPYGDFTYGTARPIGDGVPARLRSWSLSNFGQDLVASYSDGEIYYWTRNQGPSTRAQLIDNAPTGVQRLIVDSQSQFVIALGCSDLTDSYDAMMVRWCNEGDPDTWFPALINNAGFIILAMGSRLVTGIQTRGQNLLWSDTQLYRMVLGGANVYTFYPAGAMKIVGPDAAIDVNGMAYAMGFDNFYTYDGTLQILDCEVWDTVFNNDIPGNPGFNRSQAEMVHVYIQEGKSEVTWLYPSNLGPGECDRYVTFNYETSIWYYGALDRTAMRESSPAITGAVTNPYGVANGFLYEHEVGVDAVEQGGVVALPYWLASCDLTTGGAKGEYTLGGSDARFAIGGSEAGLLVNSVVPDWKYFTGEGRLTLSTKTRPNDAKYVVKSKLFDGTDAQIDIRAQGSQIALRIDNLTVPLAYTTELLMHFDGSGGSTNFPDAAGLNTFTTTPTGAIVGPDDPRFGTGCFDTTLFSNLRSSLRCPNNIGGPLDLGTDDFTVECFFRIAANIGNIHILCAAECNDSINSGWRIYFNQVLNNDNSSVGQCQFQPFGDGAPGSLDSPNITIAGTDGVPITTWHHVAVSRQNGVINIWLDGNSTNTGSAYTYGLSPSMSDPQGFFINGDYTNLIDGQDNYLRGAMDELRITRGAVYDPTQATIVVPSQPFSAASLAASTGASFRMGILQALATPYVKR